MALCRPQMYTIDEAALESSFKALQRRLHPDKHANTGDQVRGYAEAHSARLNEAYATLGDPAARARYLLQLEGHPMTDEETVDDPVLLLEVRMLCAFVVSFWLACCPKLHAFKPRCMLLTVSVRSRRLRDLSFIRAASTCPEIEGVCMCFAALRCTCCISKWPFTLSRCGAMHHRLTECSFV